YASKIAGRTSQPITFALYGLALYQLARGRIANNAAQQFCYAERAAALRQQPLALGLDTLGLLQGLGGRWLAPASALLMYALLSGFPPKARPKAATSSLRTRPYERLRSFLPGRKRHPGH